MRLAWDSLRGSSMSWAHMSSVLSIGGSSLDPITHCRSHDTAIQLYSFCAREDSHQLVSAEVSSCKHDEHYVHKTKRTVPGDTPSVEKWAV